MRGTNVKMSLKMFKRNQETTYRHVFNMPSLIRC